MQDKANTRATLAKRQAEVKAMFDGVAARYDLMNDLMTVGLARLWRAELVRAIDPRPGQRILDLAAGTGTSSRPFADAGALVVAADISIGMLAEGRRRQPDLAFVAADALALPFADRTFDAVTISFGLRNVEDPVAGLRELHRVTRPGGIIVVHESSTPTWPPFRAGHRLYLSTVLPALSRIGSNPRAYEYLAESMLDWPDQRGLAEMMSSAGWLDVEWKNLTGGIVALHRGTA